MASRPGRDTLGGIPEFLWGYSMLKDTAIRNAKPKAKPYRMTDGLGLYLMVTPTGGKLWRWKYRFQGVEKLMSFGQYQDVPLEKARKRHGAARELLADGVDPMEQRKAEKAARSDSFESVAALWLAHWRVDKSERHADTTERRLKRNVFPKLGEKTMDAIEAADLVKMAKAIEARGAGDLARRALETTGQIFEYAIAHGYAKRNPAKDFKPSVVLKPLKRRNLARVDSGALPGLLRAIEIYRGKVLTRLAMKLMAMTFVRTGELIGGEWCEIDFEARRWNIPAERMKMRTPHIVPLSTQVIEVLSLLHEITGSGKLMFPGDIDPDRTMSNNTILFALDRMGYGGIMTGHGFRGIASTLLHEQGWPHEHIELQLAHAPRNAVSAAYNHALYLEPRAKMMQAWGDHLEKLQKKVVSIRHEVA
jgi:integrase